MKKVRIIYTDNPALVMPEHKGKVFAVIGPFEGHQDKSELQAALKTLLTLYNMQIIKAR